MSLADSLENAALDAMLGSSATLLGGSLEVALSTTTPNDDGTNFTEPSGYGYARVPVTNNDANWPAASGGEKKNANTITFPTASGGSWGTVTHWGILDGGNVKIFGIIDDGAGGAAPRTILDGDQFLFLANQLRITMD